MRSKREGKHHRSDPDLTQLPLRGPVGTKSALSNTSNAKQDCVPFDVFRSSPASPSWRRGRARLRVRRSAIIKSRMESTMDLARASWHAIKNTGRWGLGVVLLLLVVIIWVSSSVLMQVRPDK